MKHNELKQEPVEWGVDWGPDGNSVSIIKRLADGGIEVVGWEYAPHQPQRQPLTDEQREKIYKDWCDKRDEASYDDLMLAVEAAHGIKGKQDE